MDENDLKLLSRCIFNIITGDDPEWEIEALEQKLSSDALKIFNEVSEEYL